MRILFVAISESIHTARWITQIADQGWDLHLFPSIDNGLFHPDLRNITVHHSFYGNPLAHHNSLKLRGIPLISKAAAYLARKAVGTYNANYRISQLQYTIKRLQPDIIHSMEIQAAGYLTMAVKNQLKNN
ncbi:MAG: hypothetical protein JW920_00965, partial [Deltaproteobacteria bacterium]|nr:hypothetical protein [Deltaproteobacteria bacterium]